MLNGERCDFCDSGRLRLRRVREYYRGGRSMVIIDSVPAFVCDQCGHRYFAAKVAKDMRTLFRRRSRLKDRVSFPRVSFAAAKATS